MAKRSLHILVGMGGWQLEPFNGVFYPLKQPKGFRKLEFYSRFFDTVEVNATFYSNGFTPANARQWLTDVAENRNFIFSVKLFRGFTHTMEARQRDVSIVLALLEPLAAEEKLGGIIIQFPYSFTYAKDRCEYLAKLSYAFRPHCMFVELRHKTWYSPDTMQFLRDHDLHLLNVDLPQFKNLMPLTQASWGGVAYFRLMGRNADTWDHAENIGEYSTVSNRYLYRYSEDELKQIAGIISTIEPTPQRTFAVFHNDPHANSLLNGFQMRRYVNPGEALKAPASLRAAFPELLSITTPADQSTPLFPSQG